MDKARKKKIKRIIALVCVVVLVAALALMPLIAKQEPEENGPKASILSGTVSAGSIDTEVLGGGSLEEEDAVTVTVPAAVKLKAFLVSNGDTVTEGTALASVDRISVMTAISQVQETLEYLSEQIETVNKKVTQETVTALAGGTVKIVYAEAGEAVQNVMLEHGALAVLSLDGLMAVDLETDSQLTSGSIVTVTLSDGTQVEGKVVKNLAGQMTVTLEDDSYAVGEAVQIATEDGEAVGAGPLYIYSPWNATAYAGTVSSVNVSVGDRLYAGSTLMVLKDVGYSAAYRQLIAQRQAYEELMLELFQMYQTESITAPCDGVVSGIDKESLQLLSGSGQSYKIVLLANAPNGDDSTSYANFVGKVAAVGSNGWALLLNPQQLAITDYTDLSAVSLDEKSMTQVYSYIPAAAALPEEDTPAQSPGALPEGAPAQGENDAGQMKPSQMEAPSKLQTAPVFELVDGKWQKIEASDISAGDILLLAADNSGEFVWIVRIQKGKSSSVTPGGSFPSGGMNGYPQGGLQEEDPFELYGLDMAQIAAVTPQNTMTLEITVDELDVKMLQAGMEAQVQIDALGGEKFQATVSQIGNTGTNNGGSSKYTVELTMVRAGDMLAGMNATATIVLSSSADLLTVCADGLVEQGNQTVVYTGYDEEKETLLDPVVVKVGVSDGETVEILEGLTAGQTYYYAYYDTLEISVTPESGGGFPFG